MREEEVCSLNCEGEDDLNSDIDFINNKCYIKHAIKQNFETKAYEEYELKSDYSKRGISLSEIAMKSLKEYLKYRKQLVNLLKLKLNSTYKNLPKLFLNKDGDYFRPRYVGKLWKKFARKYDIHVTFHSLRHTYITYQMNYNNNLTPSEVQALAGHANIQTTYHYIHKSEEKLKLATTVFDNVFNNKIDINDDNSLCANNVYCFYYYRKRICRNIIDFLQSINPQNEITYNNLSNCIDETKNYLISNYLSLENMISLN